MLVNSFEANDDFMRFSSSEGLESIKPDIMYKFALANTGNLLIMSPDLSFTRWVRSHSDPLTSYPVS
jgi:hypothetical protein